MIIEIIEKWLQKIIFTTVILLICFGIEFKNIILRVAESAIDGIAIKVRKNCKFKIWEIEIKSSEFLICKRNSEKLLRKDM